MTALRRGLLVLLVVVLAVLAVPRRHDDAVRMVDYGRAVAQARAADAAVLVPTGLPQGWRPTSVRLDADGGSMSWHVGFVTPRDRYASVEETDGPARRFVLRMTSAGRPLGSRQVAGTRWQERLRPDKDQRSLAGERGGLTVVVTGTASFTELAQLAASLRSQ